LQLKALEVPSFPAGLLVVRDIAAQHPVLCQERRVYCLRRMPLLRAADVLVSGTKRNGSYELYQRPCHAAGVAAIAPIRPVEAVIHRVFNHAPPASLRRLRAFFGDTLAGIQRRITGPSLTGRSPVTYHPGHKGKQTRAPFRAQPRRPDLLPLAVVSSDTAGPFQPLSADGALHFGTLVDKATRFTLGKALPRKSDAAQFVNDGLKRLQLITGRIVGRYHSDGARELMMPTLVTFLQAQEAETNTTAAQSPSGKPDPAGKNRAIFNAVRTALTTSGIEHRYWTYAAADAVNKLNFIPQRRPDGQYSPPIIALGRPDLPDDTNASPAIWPAWLSHRYTRYEPQACAPRPTRPIPNGDLEAPVPSTATRRHSPPGAGQRNNTYHR
jgi:hypothetical protein